MDMDLNGTKFVIMMAVQCEITYLAPYSGKNGLLKVRDSLDIPGLLVKITHYDRLLKLRGLKVVWTLPCPNNFLRFNMRRVALSGLASLNERETAEAEWSRQKMTGYVMEIRSKMAERKLMAIELGVAIGNADNCGGDGLHWDTTCREEMMRKVVGIAKDYCQANEVSIEMTGPARTIKQRESRRNRRRKQRLLRSSFGAKGGKSVRGIHISHS